MKTKQLFFATLATVGLFTACQEGLNDNPDAPQFTDPIDVTLRISGGEAVSRVVDDDATTDLMPNFNDAIIYFYNTSGHILNVENVSSTTQLATSAGQVFQEINPNATDVYIVGNISVLTDNEKSALSSATNIDAVDALVFSLTSQQADHKNVTLGTKFDSDNYSDQDAKIKLNNDNGNYEAKVLIGPALSRLQLADIKSNDSRIQDFTVEGIYVDNFLPNFLVSTTLAQTTATNTVGTDATLLGSYTPNLSDVHTSGIVAGSDKTVKAGETDGSGDNKVWGYNLAPTSATEGSVPTIIIHLSNVKYLDSKGATQTMDDAYLTVTKYMDGSNEITNFESGKMYNIASGQLDFSYDDLDVVPNAEDVELTVAVTVCPWVVNNVTPVL